MRSLCLLLVFAILPGCTHSTSPTARATNPSSPLHEAPLDTSYGDPCNERLQNLGGALLEYYFDHKHLPAHLADLRETSPDVQFTCPTSGEQYIYVPSGLSVPGSSERLILFDATPAHGGFRNALVLGKDAHGNMLTWPKKLSEKDFQSYRPSKPILPPKVTTSPNAAG